MSNPTEAELRRAWGDSYDVRMNDVVDAFDALSPEAQERVNKGTPADLKALAAMRSDAYLNPKHPDHAAVSNEVSERFNSLFGSDPAVL